MARTHFVYRAYDDADRLLYVGCTKNLKQRRAGHRQGSAWFAYAVLGDVTEREISLAIDGVRLPNVRRECGCLT